MRGYRGLPEETAEVLLEDGSLRTGDMGRLDEDGYLFLTGRIKEQYKLENGKYVVPSPLEEKLKLSPVIEQIMLYGDGRPHNVALIVIDPAAVADRLDRPVTRQGAATDPEVIRLVQSEMDRLAADFKSYERPRAFALCPEDFTQENGLLTPSLKVKRNAVLLAYERLLGALYG
jgi:long-chain acyl-CoA synthetase